MKQKALRAQRRDAGLIHVRPHRACPVGTRALSHRPFYVSGTAFTIAPRETKTYSTSCVAKSTIKVTRLLGHMHEWGVRNTITITDATGDHVVYDKPGAGDFSYNPPFVDYPADKPLVINPGDKIATTCTWTNTRDTALSFPDEMCAAFGYVIGNDAELGCADGSWNR